MKIQNYDIIFAAIPPHMVSREYRLFNFCVKMPSPHYRFWEERLKVSVFFFRGYVRKCSHKHTLIFSNCIDTQSFYECWFSRAAPQRIYQQQKRTLWSSICSFKHSFLVLGQGGMHQISVYFNIIKNIILFSVNIFKISRSNILDIMHKWSTIF